MKGYCDICNKEYANIYQHRQTQIHKRKAENTQKENQENDEPKRNIRDDNTDIYTEGEKQETGSRKPDTTEVPKMSNNEDMQENNKTIAGIQIIDSNTGKKQPSSIEKLLEVAFSEQFAPITLSIMDGIAKRLTGNANNEVQEGNFVTTVSGAIIKVPNKEF